MRNRNNDSTTAIKVVSAIIFCIFIFSYVYLYQGGLYGMLQYAWSGGKTHYDIGIGAAIITLVAVATTGVCSLFAHHLLPRIKNMVYTPALMFIAMLSSATLENGNVSLSTWSIVMAMAIIALSLFIGSAVSHYSPFLTPLRGKGMLSQMAWTNYSLLALLIFIVCALGNNDRTLHTRLQTEYHINEGRYEEALATGYPRYDNDSSLTMLRALALARQGELGERLFNYNITGGSQALLPKPDKSVAFLLGNGYNLWQTIGKVPYNQAEPTIKIIARELKRDLADTLTVDSGHRIHRLRPVAKDYLLCAYLLDRNLSAFARTLPQYYHVNDSMPQHYKEAVLLCRSQGRQIVADSLKNSALETDYADFMKALRQSKDPKVREVTIRDSFFGTYWYYFYSRN